MEPGCSKTLEHSSSTEGEDSLKEENFVESLTTQVDDETIVELISIQKKSLARFEKTNEMLSTCRQLTEKRLEEVKKQFNQGRNMIQQAKTDLNSVFRRLKAIKLALAEKYPEIYTVQVDEAEIQFPPEAED